MSLSQVAPSMGYTDMETPEGRIFMLRQKVQTCAMMRADRDGVRERSKSPLEPWALQVAKETVLKCERVVSMSTEHVPDETVDALLQAEGVNLLSPMEHRVGRFFGSQEGFEWSRADRSDENFLHQHVQIATEPLGLVLKLLNGLEKYVALCYMMRMAASPDFKIVVCGYGFDAADFARELVRAKQAGAQVLFLMDQGQARSASAESASTLGILSKGGIEVRLCRGFRTDMEYRLNREDQAFPSGIFHQKSVYVHRRDSHVAYLIAGSSNHTTYSRCSDELDIMSLVLVAHPETAITLHRWEQASLRAVVWKSDQVDSDGRVRFATVAGDGAGSSTDQRGPFTRIALINSVEAPFVPQKDNFDALFRSPP